MQSSFLPLHKKYFLLAITLYQQKMHEKTPNPILFILTHFHQKINRFSSEKSCPHILLFPFPYLSPYLYSSTTQKLHIYKALKKIIPKKNKKEEDICILKKKNYQKKT